MPTTRLTLRLLSSLLLCTSFATAACVEDPDDPGDPDELSATMTDEVDVPVKGFDQEPGSMPVQLMPGTVDPRHPGRVPGAPVDPIPGQIDPSQAPDPRTPGAPTDPLPGDVTP